MSVKKIVLTALISLLSLSAFCAEDTSREIPVIKIPVPIHSVAWNKVGDLFAYNEGSNITVRKEEDISVYQYISTDEEIMDLQFAGTSVMRLNQLLSYDTNNEINIRRLPDTTPTTIKVIGNKTNLSKVEISSTGDNVALGRSDGVIELYYQLYYSRQFYSKEIRAHKKPVYSLCFSSNFKLLMSCSEDGYIKIFETDNGRCLFSEKNPSKQKYPAIFGPHNSSIVIAKDSDTILIRNLIDDSVQTFDIDAKIRAYEISADKKSLIVVTEDNQFRFYDFETHTYNGFIPFWDSSRVTAYKFSPDGTKLLIGHEDGTLFVLKVESVFYKPDEVPGVYKMYEADEKGKSWLYDASKGVVLKDDEFVSRITHHNIVMKAELRGAMCDYYTWGSAAGLGYVNDKLIWPFYGGAYISPVIIGPDNDFNYEYKIDDIVLPNPYIVGIEFQVVAGRYWTPFENKWIELFAETDMGFGFRKIYSPLFGSGDDELCLFWGLMGGVRYKDFTFYAGANYDSILTLNFMTGVGYKIRISARREVPDYKYDPKKSSENKKKSENEIESDNIENSNAAETKAEDESSKDSADAASVKEAANE